MADADPIEQLVQQTRAFVDSRAVPDLAGAVMGQIEHLGPGRVPARGWIARFGRSLWSPRLVSFEFRPAYALVAAAGVLILMAVPFIQSPAVDGPLRVASNEPVTMQVYVQFRLQTADAMEVRLAGSFTHWQPEYQLHQTAPGLWTVTLPLNPGVHDYAFIVDGQRWVTDPYAPSIQDGFGGTNSRITLLAGDDRHL